MDSSSSRRTLVNPPEDLDKRPTLQFIMLMSKVMAANTKTAKDIAGRVKDVTKTKEVITTSNVFGKSILNMNDTFLEYEKGHVPLVDIKYKERVQNRQIRAHALEKKLKNVPAEHQRKTSEIEDKIKDLRVDKRDVNRERLVTEVTDININTADVVDAKLVRDKKVELQKKIKGVCCPCTDAGTAKIQKYSDLLDDVNRQLADIERATKIDKERNKDNRLSKEEKIKVYDQDIAELKRQRSQHIGTPIIERIEEVEVEFGLAEESLERAKANLADAELESLKNIGRIQFANLLHLVAQFLAFKQALDNLYKMQREVLRSSADTEKDKLDSIMRKIADFQAQLKTDQEEIEEALCKFKCSEAALRTGKKIYLAYVALDDGLKKEFAQNSFVDTIILDKIIAPVSAVIGTIKPERVTSSISDNHSTLHSRHLKKPREKAEVANSAKTSDEEVSSAASPSQKRGSGKY